MSIRTALGLLDELETILDQIDATHGRHASVTALDLLSGQTHKIRAFLLAEQAMDEHAPPTD